MNGAGAELGRPRIYKKSTVLGPKTEGERQKQDHIRRQSSEALANYFHPLMKRAKYFLGLFFGQAAVSNKTGQPSDLLYSSEKARFDTRIPTDRPEIQPYRLPPYSSNLEIYLHDLGYKLADRWADVKAPPIVKDSPTRLEDSMPTTEKGIPPLPTYTQELQRTHAILQGIASNLHPFSRDAILWRPTFIDTSNPNEVQYLSEIDPNAENTKVKVALVIINPNDRVLLTDFLSKEETKKFTKAEHIQQVIGLAFSPIMEKNDSPSRTSHGDVTFLLRDEPKTIDDLFSDELETKAAKNLIKRSNSQGKIPAIPQEELEALLISAQEEAMQYLHKK